MLARSAKTVRRATGIGRGGHTSLGQVGRRVALVVEASLPQFPEWRGGADTHGRGTGNQSPLASRAPVGKATRLLNIRILLFHQDPLVILHSCIRSGCSLQTLLPFNARKLPQKARRPLRGPQLRYILHPIAYVEASNAVFRAFISCTALPQACPALVFYPPSGFLGRYSTRLSLKVTLLQNPSFPSTTFRT